MLRWTEGDPKAKPRDAFRRWYDAYVACLADAHLRSAGDRLAGKPAMSHVPGAGLDLADRIETHLFVVCPNNSGSSFLTAALETCRAAWRLPREGQMIRGSPGRPPGSPRGANGGSPACCGFRAALDRPLLRPAPLRLAAHAQGVAAPVVTAVSEPDWPRTRRAWYWYARAHHPHASVFVTKSTHHVLHVEQLVRHFRNARFAFMVRNPTPCAKASAGATAPGSPRVTTASSRRRAGACRRQPRPTSPTAWPGSAATSKRTGTAASSPTRRCARTRRRWRCAGTKES